jgi:hypothetical protein
MTRQHAQHGPSKMDDGWLALLAQLTSQSNRMKYDMDYATLDSGNGPFGPTAAAE